MLCPSCESVPKEPFYANGYTWVLEESLPTCRKMIWNHIEDKVLFDTICPPVPYYETVACYNPFFDPCNVYSRLSKEDAKESHVKECGMSLYEHESWHVLKKLVHPKGSFPQC